MSKRLQIKIYGRVQGVGFRFSAYEKFVELGLQGRAENGPEGTVEIDVTGEDPALEKFVEWCHRGPFDARVSKVEVTSVQDNESNHTDSK